ncbi:MAG TPA: tetratricopeptide repeat protein [Pyrinomonadaceae bacterium]|nr:tetratricopeptide repeat protein [Pyrinomonadaceae bacterium]
MKQYRINLILRIPFRRFVQSITFLLSMALLGNAQGVGSSRGLSSGGGSNTIQGRVYFPSGEQNSGKTVRMHLESNETIGGQSTVTDQDGVFRFNGLPPGNYTVVVDGGKDYENSREPVSIYQGSNGRIVQVAIQLKPKIDSANPAFAGVPHGALDLYQKGTTASQKGDAKGAVEFLSKAVAAYPDFTLAISQLGAEYLKLSQWDKATETFESLVKLKPNDASAHLDLGIALYNSGSAFLSEKKVDEANQKLGSAEAQLREAIKLNNPGPSAHYYLGMTLVKARRYDEAQTELELAIKNGGANIALAHRFLGGLYQRVHKDKEAADEFEAYLKLDPKVKDAETIKGMIQKLRGQ